MPKPYYVYGILQVLSISSPFFATMFGNKNFKEGRTSVTQLPDKKFEVVVWMLDYIYPTESFTLTGELYELDYCNIKDKRFNMVRPATCIVLFSYQK